MCMCPTWPQVNLIHIYLQTSTCVDIFIVWKIEGENYSRRLSTPCTQWFLVASSACRYEKKKCLFLISTRTPRKCIICCCFCSHRSQRTWDFNTQSKCRRWWGKERLRIAFYYSCTVHRAPSRFPKKKHLINFLGRGFIHKMCNVSTRNKRARTHRIDVKNRFA